MYKLIYTIPGIHNLSLDKFKEEHYALLDKLREVFSKDVNMHIIYEDDRK